MDKNKKTIIILMILTIVFTIMGGTFAYWSWSTNTSQKTNITFSITSDFSCAADGGGDITSSNVNLVPTVVSSTTTGNYIKREVKVTPTINTTGKTVYMDLWLDIKTLGTGLSNTDYFRYAFTTGSSSPDDGIVYSGNFRGLIANNRIKLLLDKEYTSTTTETYYLWIWLDAAETDSATMNQSFHLVLNGNCTDTKVEPNAPVLDDGMIPVVFDTTEEETIIKTVSSTDPSWYDYSRQEWANVVLVKESGTSTRELYKSAAEAGAGILVEKDDILAYYVWIPRYKYKIWETAKSSKGKEQTIEIEFENTNSTTTGTQVGEYITHPAFNINGMTMDGIWVGKFETTGTSNEPIILPEENGAISSNVSEQFEVSLKFSGGTYYNNDLFFDGNTTYGLTEYTDTHMMKNSEWGAVAYLSHSKYGVNRQIFTNSSAVYYTGRSSGDTKNSNSEEYTWDGYISTSVGTSNRDLTKVASTTGNITGIYDMSGGAWEYVMGTNSDVSTTFNPGSTLPSRYYDKYTTTDELTACNGGLCYGHGLSETTNWYGSDAKFFDSSNLWLIRGGASSISLKANIFSYDNLPSGAGNQVYRFRSVAIVNQ